MVASQKSQHGFTIVETLLVLAITGLMVSGILVGIGTSVSNQRYRDSVQTLRGVLQNEYSNLVNVANERKGTLSCDDNAVVGTDASLITNRGQSKCVVVGRYISIINGDITTANVNAYPIPDLAVTSTDVATLKSNYRYGLSLDTKQSDILEWGTRMKAINPTAGTRDITNIGILLLRSPLTGQSYTFVTDNPSPSDLESINGAALKAMIDPTAMQSRILCVDANGLRPISDLSVQIDQNATGPTSIEQKSNDSLPDGGLKCQ